MFKLIINRFFDAAHMLPDSDELVTKGCAGLHGHTYKVTVEFYSSENKRNGMVVDFKAIKDIIDRFDHTTILKNSGEFSEIQKVVNDIRNIQGLTQQKFIYIEGAPTAENIAKEIYFRIVCKYPDCSQGLKVTVVEGYKGEESSSSSTYEE